MAQKLEHRAHAVRKGRALLAPADNDRICVLHVSDDRLVVVGPDGGGMRAQERGAGCSKGEEVDDGEASDAVAPDGRGEVGHRRNGQVVGGLVSG